VAGFVGATNRLEPALARAATGREEALLVRPEKMRLLDPDARADAEEWSLAGVVAEATYLGPFTRYRVVADAGGDLLVVAPNRGDAAEDARAAVGRKVRVAFRKSAGRPLDAEAPGPSGSGEV
jgi:ABC-type Fe3+/spermidine/putrescine transport system ATPase subunit